jgi:glycerophosphoryl diester phosphodiesterase
MKIPGYEREVVDGLTSRGLAGRALISSFYLHSLDKVAALAPDIRRGLSVPLVKRDYTQTVLALPAYGIARVIAHTYLPRKIRRLMREGRIQAVMSHWILVSRGLVEAVHAEGGEVYVWTVDDLKRIDRLRRLGVHAVITNDPRLFATPQV